VRLFLSAGCSEGGGGGLDLMADLLFTCCVPLKSSAPTVSQVLPVRREDIDHRNNEILGASRTGNLCA
jgi:hypothetical protein